MLDQAAITESPAGDESMEIFSDARVLRAPLPGLQDGAIVEDTPTAQFFAADGGLAQPRIAQFLSKMSKS